MFYLYDLHDHFVKILSRDHLIGKVFLIVLLARNKLKMKQKLILLFLLISTTSFGQFSKKSVLLGGNLGVSFNSSSRTFNGTTADGGSYTSFSFGPQVGYFFADNFAGGLGVSLQSTSFKQPSSSTRFSNSYFLVTPFARYYIKNFYFQGSVGFGNTSRDNQDFQGNLYTSKSKLFNWSLTGGYAIMLNKYVALEPQVSYNHLTTTPSDVTNLSFISSNSNLSLQLGLQVYLHKQ